jgi:hypothetical protein
MLMRSRGHDACGDAELQQFVVSHPSVRTLAACLRPTARTR